MKQTPGAGNLLDFVSPRLHVRPMGGHFTCGCAKEIDLTAPPWIIWRPLAGTRAGSGTSAPASSTDLLPSTCRGAVESNPGAVSLVLLARLHARPMGVHRTCRGADGLELAGSRVVERLLERYWRENYDLAHIVARDWNSKGLGSKLAGKIHIYVGQSDTYYLNDAVYFMYVQSTEMECDIAMTASVAFNQRIGSVQFVFMAPEPQSMNQTGSFLDRGQLHHACRGPTRHVCARMCVGVCVCVGGGNAIVGLTAAPCNAERDALLHCCFGREDTLKGLADPPYNGTVQFGSHDGRGFEHC